MGTRYDWDDRPTDTIDLDNLAKGKDADFLLRFGGAEFVIQYRLENAGREGHPFIDIVTVPYLDASITVDLCDADGAPIRRGQGEVYQILLGQKT